MALDLRTDSTSRVGGRTAASRKGDQSSLLYGKLPPQARELEEAVLGAIMLEADKLSDVLEVLPSEECFYVETHKIIYSAIKSLAQKGQVVDLLTVIEELKSQGQLELVGGQFAITRLTNAVVSSAHVVTHARIVLEKFILRELIRISGDMVTDAYEDSAEVFELLDKAESNLFKISNNYLRKNYSSIGDVIVETMDQIRKSREEKEDITGVTSGYATLDALTAGWQKTDLIILAARPSVGKTAFALNLALNAAVFSTKPKGVAVFSLEMGNTQLVKRMLSTVTEVSLSNINRGRLDEVEFAKISQNMHKLADAPIYIDDQAGLTIFEFRAKARRLKAKHDIELIIIDYLQLMHGGEDKRYGNREQEISKISRELKGVAKELDIPVIALSQLSRAVETRGESKLPQLSDLRESGAIEQDADMVMFIYRPEYHNILEDEQGNSTAGQTHINIAKHRNGKLGSVKLVAELEIQKFVEVKDNQMSNFNFGRGNQNDGSGMSVDSGMITRESAANNMSFDDNDDDWDSNFNPNPSRLKRPNSDLDSMDDDDGSVPF